MINPSGNLTKHATNIKSTSNDKSSLPVIISGIDLDLSAKNNKTDNDANDANGGHLPSVYYKPMIHVNEKDNDTIFSTLV